MATPRCHPDSAAIPRRRMEGWRKSITYDALGWHMAERMQQSQLLPGDTLDIAFSLEQNDDTNFGGLGLSLRDFRKIKTTEDTEDTEGESVRAASQ